ncbi:ankyrin repeat-containing domain protein, partial [Mycena albidolilacea]
RLDFLDWLSPINFFPRQEDIFRVRQKGTGEWLLVHPHFQEWKSGSRRTLWCRGIRASIVVKHLSDEYENNKEIGVACIYLNHKDVDDQTPSKLLAALWRQLVHGRDVGFIAKKLYQQHREKRTMPSLEEVVHMLSSSLKELSKVFIIVDAVDEYPELQRGILLKHLAAIGSNVNLMITSRPNISLKLFSFPNLETLDIHATKEDLQRYIDAQIDSSPRLHVHVKALPKLREEIHAKIIGSVGGMFLLAELHVQSISTKNTIKAVQNALEGLAKNLPKGYDSAMDRIKAQNEDDKKTAYSTLTWVANAKRPLRVKELQVALAIEPDTRQLNQNNILEIEIIVAVCAGLVIVDEQSDAVRLVHYTTQEYLDSIQDLLFPDAQTEITCTLLTFLTFDGYPDPSWTNPWHLPPLVDYSQYALAHAAGQPEIQLRDILLKFLKIVRLLLENGANVNATGEKHSSALHTAIVQGNTEIVCLLLEKGANVNVVGKNHSSGLHTAITKGKTEIVHLLLEKGANVNAGGKYESPLQAAIIQGCTDIVFLLLKKGANVNAAGENHSSVLHTAIGKGNTEIVRLLLENGANVNAAGENQSSALHTAVVKGKTEIVCLLLENGANVNAVGENHSSALHTAVVKGKTEIVHLLLDKGATVNTVEENHSSALHTAITKGKTEIVRLLLEKGANVNAGGKYESPLQAAIIQGCTDIVCLLLEKGANVDAAGENHSNVLHTAIGKGNTEIVRLLLENGANAAG